MKRQIVLGIILIFILVTSLKIYKDFKFTNNTKEIVFQIESGLNLKEISKQLEDKEVIGSSQYFTLYTKFKGLENSLKAGKFKIPPKIDLATLLAKLQKPEYEYTKITIPEGYTVYQIANKLDEENLVNKEKFLDILQNSLEKLPTKDNLDNTIYTLEGYIFPDTYFIPIGFQEKEIINMTLNRFNQVFTDEYRKRAKEVGLSINEIITIASLIEKEAANDSERKTISGVIYNRLENNIPLQIDAAVIYGITKGESHIKRLFYKDLKFDSLYNTYKYKGLPPGPIASPGIASIQAALYPQDHDYFYYVFNGESHVFSKTYNEHLNNKRKYIDSK